MALAVEQNVAADPGDIGLLGPPTVVAKTHGCADPVEQARLWKLCWTYFTDEEQGSVPVAALLRGIRDGRAAHDDAPVPIVCEENRSSRTLWASCFDAESDPRQEIGGDPLF
jgi:hypothetical protein